MPVGAQPEAAAPDLAVVVVRAEPVGVDPLVAAQLTEVMTDVARGFGYRIVDEGATTRAVRAVGMPYPPSPSDLWRATRAAGAERGVFGRVWARSGRYVVEVSVASLDSLGPFTGRGSAAAPEFLDMARRLVEQVLPARGTWRGLDVPREEASWPALRVDPFGATLRHRRRETWAPFRIAIQTEGVIGVSKDAFYNHLVGARFDWNVARDVAVGVYGGYANLRGRDGRVANGLVYLMAENRLRITSRSPLTIPLRIAVGYLPYNGPVVRLSGGLNIPVGERYEIGLDLVTPTFWVLPDRTVFSLDVGAEFGVRF
ncbi:MAG: hypothetical protein R3A78_08785 [Polyangiales bacterium]